MTTHGDKMVMTRARRMLRSCNFAPVPPFRVEPFTGGLILAGGVGGNIVTDFHIVDRRGRTVKVFPYGGSGGNGTAKQGERARRYVEAMNNATAVCPYCGDPADYMTWPRACHAHSDLPGLEPL